MNRSCSRSNVLFAGAAGPPRHAVRARDQYECEERRSRPAAPLRACSDLRERLSLISTLTPPEVGGVERKPDGAVLAVGAWRARREHRLDDPRANPGSTILKGGSTGPAAPGPMRERDEVALIERIAPMSTTLYAQALRPAAVADVKERRQKPLPKW